MTALTKTRIDTETNVASIAAARECMFSKESLMPVVSATEHQTAIINSEQRLQTNQLEAINANLMALGRTMNSLQQTRNDPGSPPPLARANF